MTQCASESSVLTFQQPRRPTTKTRRLPDEDQPRERMLRSGCAALSDAELLSCLLLGGARLDALEVAQQGALQQRLLVVGIKLERLIQGGAGVVTPASPVHQLGSLNQPVRSVRRGRPRHR